MEPTGIEPVTSCLQSFCGNPRFPHQMRTFAAKSAWGADLSHHFRTYYGGEPGEGTWRGPGGLPASFRASGLLIDNFRTADYGSDGFIYTTGLGR